MTGRWFLIFLVASAAITIVLFTNAEMLPAFGLMSAVSLTCIWRSLRTEVSLRKVFQNLPDNTISSNDETVSSVIEKMHEQIDINQQVIAEIEKIGAGRFENISGSVGGHAGAALTRAKDKLEAIKREETRRIWTAQGIAKMSELSKSHRELHDFAFHIITQIIKYLDASQGAFYLLRETASGKMLECYATYAYGDVNTKEKPVSIDAESGLLGQSIHEKEIIVLAEVPGNYVKIGSGLGEASPRSLIVAPLIFNGQTYGVMEIASFRSTEQYQVDFIQKVCEVIAGELSSMLKEDELNAKLREVETEREKNIAILNGCMDGVISFNQNGIIEFVNVAARGIFNTEEKELLGKDIRNLLQVTINTGQNGDSVLLAASGNEVSTRTEVNAQQGDLTLLLTLAKVRVNQSTLFTLFIQKISVDLF